jgi:hypothetical protein
VPNFGPLVASERALVSRGGKSIKKELLLSVAYSRGVGGVQTPPPMTGPTKIFSIEFNMVYSVLCVIYAVSLAQ